MLWNFLCTSLPTLIYCVFLAPYCKVCVIRSLFQNIGLTVLLNLLIKSAWIILNFVVQNRIGHDEYGIYPALFSLGFLLLAFADLGLNQFTTKTLANKPEKIPELYPHLFGLKVTLSALFPFILMGVGYLIGYRGHELVWLFILSLTHSLLQLMFFFRGNIQAFQKFRLEAYTSILERLILIGIVGFLLATHITLDSFIWAMLGSAFFSMVILYFVTRRLTGNMLPRFKPSEWPGLIRQAFPFALILLLYSINDKVDQVMLERMLPEGKYETSLYAAAYRWVDVFAMYLWTVLPIFFAKFARHSQDTRSQSALLPFGQTLTALPLIFVSVFIYFYGDKLLFLLTDSSPAEIDYIAHNMRILFFATLLNGIFAIFSTLLTSVGHERFVSWMILCSILINGVLNLIFIPQYQALAASYATVASFAFLSVTYTAYLAAKLDVKVPWMNMLKLAGSALPFVAIFMFLESREVEWYLVSAVSGLVLLTSAWLMGLLRLPSDVDID